MSNSLASDSSRRSIAPFSSQARPAIAGAWLPLLLVLFIGSGCAALIYEIVWFQLLQLVIGASAYSIGVLLGTFMGGMCIGSLLFSRFCPRHLHPLRVYACLELAIAVMGVLMTVGMPLFDHLYIAIASPGANAVALRAFVCALCLLPPTILMGATLPAISRWVETTPRGMSWLGIFYGGNTAGAVLGCLLAGFYLLRYFDMTTATYIAAGINVLVATCAFKLAQSAAYTPPVEQQPVGKDKAASPENKVALASVYLVIGLSGMSALGAEVVWTRILSLLLGATTYTFSIILAVFLTGLGLGSSGGALLTRFLGKQGGTDRARWALAWAQVCCVIGIAWTAYAITNGLPGWPMTDAALRDGTVNYWFDLKRCIWATLPATLFWGASFPLALSAAALAGRDPARTVGRVYAANTLGAIVGAVLFSLFFIKMYGTQTCEHILIGISGIAAVIALRPGPIGSSAGVQKPTGTSQQLYLLPQIALAALTPYAAVHILQSNKLDVLPFRMVTWGKFMQTMGEGEAQLCMREGMNSTVAVSLNADGKSRQFHVSGKCEASTLPVDMRLQYMLGHFPAFIHPKPKSVLIVGCGAGVTAGSFILHPGIERIVICEIEPLVPEVAAQFFSEENNSVVSRRPDGKMLDPRVEIVYDDARHYILTTREKFDVITSDPIHPWVKGAATLYTREYFELLKAHLKPGGLAAQWVPLYQSSEQTVKSEIATFFSVFPDGAVWNNLNFSGGYDTVTMGREGPLKVDMAALQERISALPVAVERLRAAFANPGAGFGAMDILRTFAGGARDLKPWTADAQINYDRNLRLQYLAGGSLNTTGDAVTQTLLNILSYRKYPRDMLSAAPLDEKQLRSDWGLPDLGRAPRAP